MDYCRCFGNIITEGTGEKKGTVSIDTRQLSNGLHWVAILSSARAADGTNTGIFQFPIIVQN